MRVIIQLLRERIEQGLLTIFIKIKAHRGDPLNEQADRLADEGRQSENIRWSLPSSRPIFYWTDNGATHRSPKNPTVKKRINLQVSQQQLKIHKGSTANFLTREDSSRDLLGKFHKDRSVWIRARRRMLQCLFYQFPCALQLKQWGALNEVKCRLCEKYYKTTVSLPLSLPPSLSLFSLSLSLVKECLAQDGNEALDHHEAQAQESLWVIHDTYTHTHKLSCFVSHAPTLWPRCWLASPVVC